MAIGALSVREDTVFATPKHAGKDSGLNIFGKEQCLNSERISCLKFSCDGEFAMITMAGT
jgi:hypothetical protein